MEFLPRAWMVLAALSGLIGVAAGAFGAHGVADPQAKGWLATGAQYQLIHALAVFACAWLWRPPSTESRGSGAAGIAAWLFLAGGALFALTLYAMALGAPRILGAVTPVGGLLLLAGWATLAWAAFAGTRDGLA